MANLASLRSSLATPLQAAGRVVFSYPKENASVPAIVLVPSNPYMTPVAIGGAGNRINVRFDIYCLVAATDNQAGLGNVESLMLDVMNQLPQGTSILGGWTAPAPSEIAGQTVIQTQMTVELVTTNSGN
jgi:hypothetical protein